ncbi:YbaB/EbfC family nucleoid-associated protein [Actinokineospora bangkokensis]|uniref:YbaB/EbfC family DNA-binding protein n=1 Tax=Actinokineospora bangkokensis TaxID=1193682 RepID=A0A1Q9LQQ7_9PSEU|nr:YbaB/EbfC family nucleoid-associated protein [Actinokineospora bangkokensis]OLR94352.1 hypothetical protein BJP25_11335 [Actinokineospora bangkokensis]
MSAELDRLAAEFGKFQARIREAEARFDGVAAVQGELTALEVVATSPDRAVRVVAGAGGAVKDIQLGADAMRRPAQALAQTIMATLREAVAEAARRQAGIVDGAFGGGLGTTGLVERAQQEAAEQQAAGTGGPAAASQRRERPARRTAPDDDFDDYSDQSIYQGPR